MNDDVLKAFLVKLGFKVDESALKKFETAAETATKTVLKLSAAVIAARVAVVAGVAVISRQMEGLYYASQRTGATVENLMALRYAAAQIGLTAEQAQSSLESFARTLRLNPGSGALLKQFGIHGGDPTKQFEAFITKMKSLQPYIAAQYAQLYGIDPDTLLMLEQGQDKRLEQERKFQERLRAFGVNGDQAAKQAMEFDNSMRRLESDLSLVWTVIETKLNPVLTPLIERFERWAESHADQIAKGIADAVQNLAYWVQSVDWKKVGQDIEKVVGSLGGVKDILLILGGLSLVGPVKGVLSLVGALGKLSAAAAGLATGGGMAVLGRLGLLAATPEVLGPLAALMPSQLADDTKVMDQIRAGKIKFVNQQETPDDSNFGVTGGGWGSRSSSRSPNWADSAFGKLIARGEGDYNSVNLGARGGYKADEKDLSGMTVADVMAAQQRGDFNAAGRYQLIKSTLADAVKTLGLNGTEKFDKATQDRIFNQYLLSHKDRAIGDYLTGRSQNLAAAMNAASREWASVADPVTGRSHYAGVGNNRASISPQETANALMQTRSMSMARLGMTPTAGSKSVTVESKTEIHVAGGGDPHATARAVAGEQRRVNGDLVRNFVGAVA